MEIDKFVVLLKKLNWYFNKSHISQFLYDGAELFTIATENELEKLINFNDFLLLIVYLFLNVLFLWKLIFHFKVIM